MRMGVLMETVQKALPEKTFFFTKKPFDVSGNAVTPVTSPAFRRTESPGAMALPVLVCERTRTLAAFFSASEVMIRIYCSASS